MSNKHEIDQDRSALITTGHRYWIDITSDPQNSIGWVVDNDDGSQSIRTVVEVIAAIPTARSWIIEHTEIMLKRAVIKAQENRWSNDACARLMVELEVARSLFSESVRIAINAGFCAAAERINMRANNFVDWSEPRPLPWSSTPERADDP